MGKLILLLVIIFGAYWAWQYYKEANKKPVQPPQPDYSGCLPNEVDDLIKYFDTAIKNIETKSLDEIKKSEEVLKHFKTQLERLNQIKNKNK